MPLQMSPEALDGVRVGSGDRTDEVRGVVHGVVGVSDMNKMFSMLLPELLYCYRNWC